MNKWFETPCTRRLIPRQHVSAGLDGTSRESSPPSYSPLSSNPPFGADLPHLYSSFSPAALLLHPDISTSLPSTFWDPRLLQKFFLFFFFLNGGGWKIVKGTIRQWQTGSLKNKWKVVACLQPLSFRHARCDRSISLWCWLLLSQLLFFSPLLSMWFQMGGKSAGLWDQAILLPWIENKDDSNKKQNQLLFHSISTGKSGWEIKEIK